MTEDRALILEEGDVGIAAAAFDVFWGEYAGNEWEYYDHIGMSKEQTRTDRVLIEYIIKCDWYSDVYRSEQNLSRALIRFQAMPGNRQKLSLRIYRPSGDQRLSDFTFEPTLTEREVTKIFDSFIADLKWAGWIVTPYSATTSANPAEVAQLTRAKQLPKKPTRAQNRAKQQARTAKELRSSGKTRGEIASELKVSLRTVDRYLDMPSE